MPYRCDFEADEPPENPDRVIDGEPFLYHPTAGPDGPGRTAARFEPGALPRERPGEAGRLLDWLRSIGVRAVRVSFDGGNDEGFGRFEAALTSGGELSREELADRGAGDGTGAAIRAERTREGDLWGPAEYVTEALWNFAEELTGLYLGHAGWGNGPFLLFGAFEADLTTGQFTDLRDVEKPAEFWSTDLPPRFPPGDRPPLPPPRRGSLATLLRRLIGRKG
ncbi:hypothetical protein [Alienimonas californiensis]|uniref:Uncharacterized protein n=1 Tax=Alienimonas californiensis TaxID=2527989 RepID=A0A517P3S2_9PLAN|nr:hypothetical protein [Alienimonas californiensis]QDT14027.1 hypothetical protein CA12_00950 [Alienimonas californiensis]